MKNFKTYILIAISSIVVISCSEDDKVTVDVQNSVSRGAVLRTISQVGTAMDVLDISEAYSVELEEQDHEDGALLQEVRIYVDLVDNTDDAITNTTETLMGTIPGSSFTSGPNGLPRGSFNTTLGEMATTLGITLGDYNCGDQFNLRMELYLADGRVFTDKDATGNVSGGSFFSSPYNYRISLIAPLSDEKLFTGQYQLTTLSNGNAEAADYLDGVYTVESINNTTKVIKNVSTLPAFFADPPVVNVEFELVCGNIIFKPAQGLGAGCDGSTIENGPSQSGHSTYDLLNPDDSDFIVKFTSGENGNCAGPVQASFRLTKI